MFLPLASGEKEPIGLRIIEMPEKIGAFRRPRSTSEDGYCHDLRAGRPKIC
jgi:hypothetical protein